MAIMMRSGGDTPFEHIQNMGDGSITAKVLSVGSSPVISGFAVLEFDPEAIDIPSNNVWITFVPIDTFGSDFTEHSLWDASVNGFVMPTDTDMLAFRNEVLQVGTSGWLRLVIYENDGNPYWNNTPGYFLDRLGANQQNISANPPDWYGRWRPVD